MAITVAASGWAYYNLIHEGQLQFERRADRLIAEVARRTATTGHGLMGARDLYMGSEHVNRVEFGEYVGSRDFHREFPGAMAFGLIQRVTREGLDAFIAEAQADFAPTYTVKDDRNAEVLYPVNYIEPLAENRALWGMDLGTNPRLRAAIEKAITTDAHAVVPASELSEGGLRYGDLFYLVPLYQKGPPPESPEERLNKLVGVLFAPVEMNGLLADIDTFTETHLDFDIVDVDESAAEFQLFTSSQLPRKVSTTSPPEPSHTSWFQTKESNKIVDRNWAFYIRSTPEFEATIAHWPPILLAVVGTLLSFLSASVVWLLGHSRAQAMALTISQDVARARQAAEATHRAQLEKLLGERTLELEAAQEELVKQERLAVLGQLIATVSHELRNPLGTIRASIYMVAQRAKGSNLGLERSLDRAERNILRCDRIIEELLDYTRKRTLERCQTEMGCWLREIHGEFAFPEAVTVTCDFCDAISLHIDPANLRRCLINVWQNACDAMLDSDGNHYAKKEARLLLSSRVTENRFEIVTIDNGRGMADAEREKVFEPLYTTKTFGVGLGLSIVSEILDAHQGGIDINSTPDEGTTIILWVPIEPILEAP